MTTVYHYKCIAVTQAVRVAGEFVDSPPWTNTVWVAAHNDDEAKKLAYEHCFSYGEITLLTSVQRMEAA